MNQKRITGEFVRVAKARDLPTGWKPGDPLQKFRRVRYEPRAEETTTKSRFGKWNPPARAKGPGK